MWSRRASLNSSPNQSKKSKSRTTNLRSSSRCEKSSGTGTEETRQKTRKRFLAAPVPWRNPKDGDAILLTRKSDSSKTVIHFPASIPPSRKMP